MTGKKLILRDHLALERTKLSNERTFMAYFRTFVVILSSGLAIIKLEILEEISDLGIFLLILAPILLVLGLVRYFYVKRKIRRFYSFENNPE